LRIRVPASSANLGPGFDILALALDLCNDVTVESVDGPDIILDPGPGAPPELDNARRNTIVTAYVEACRRLYVHEARLGARFSCVNRIPLSRGLGSSAAAIVSGVVAAHAMHGRVQGSRFIVQSSKSQGAPSTLDLQASLSGVLRVASKIEGHPENVAASVLGGVVICAPMSAVKRISVTGDITSVIFVPDAESSTKEARGVVPESLSRADAVFNAARCALLARAFALGDFAGLAEAMDDRWHQSQRTQDFPAFSPLLASAKSAGAYGAALSGAGSSVIALTPTDRAADVAAEMTSAANGAGVSGRAMVVAIRNRGTEVEQVE